MPVTEGLQQRAHEMLEQMGLGEPVAAVVPKHGPGRGSAVTQDEADDIRWSYVVESKSISEISRNTGRTRETVSALVKSPEADELRKTVREMKRVRARQILAANTDKAAEKWVEAMDVAAEKGLHKPMQDLLLHEEVIKPVNDHGSGPGVVVYIGAQPADVDVHVGMRIGHSDAAGRSITANEHSRLIAQGIECGSACICHRTQALPVLSAVAEESH